MSSSCSSCESSASRASSGMSGRLGRGLGLSARDSFRKWLTRRSECWFGLVARFPCSGVAWSTLDCTPTWLKQASSWRTTSCCAQHSF